MWHLVRTERDADGQMVTVHTRQGTFRLAADIPVRLYTTEDAVLEHALLQDETQRLA